MSVLSAASFLEAHEAMRAACRQLHERFLAGKSVEELRSVLGAANDAVQLAFPLCF